MKLTNTDNSLMIRNCFIYIIILMTGLLTACSVDESLTLEILEEGFGIVQHIPVNSEERDTNALYLAPRRIKNDEFNSSELNTFILKNISMTNG